MQIVVHRILHRLAGAACQMKLTFSMTDLGKRTIVDLFFKEQQRHNPSYVTEASSCEHYPARAVFPPSVMQQCVTALTGPPLASGPRAGAPLAPGPGNESIMG